MEPASRRLGTVLAVTALAACNATGPSDVSSAGVRWGIASPHDGTAPVDGGAIRFCTGEEGNDPLDIRAVRVEGDELIVSVTYGGGCAEHGFALCWDGVFAESYPVQAFADLHHDAGGDPCEAAAIGDDVGIGLRPLRDAYVEAYRDTAATIILHVGGHAVEYTF